MRTRGDHLPSVMGGCRRFELALGPAHRPLLATVGEVVELHSLAAPPEMARRDISRCRTPSVGFKVKRTFSEPRPRAEIMSKRPNSDVRIPKETRSNGPQLVKSG
jgi:hypothetical protein